MYSSMSEDLHDSNSKGKPRLPQSQGRTATGTINGGPPALRLIESEIADRERHPSTSSSSSEESETEKVPMPLTNSGDELVTSIELVTLKDYRRVARTLYLSFEQDPFTNYILGTPIDTSKSSAKVRKHKRKLMISFFEFAVYECFSLGGIVLAIKDRALETEISMESYKAYRIPFLGVACWYRMEYDHDQLVYGYPQSASFLARNHPSSLKFNILASMSHCRSKVFKDLIPLLNEMRDKVIGNLHLDGRRDIVWYLADIGTLPTMRGKGFAKKLVNHFCETFVDASPNSWCYLESTNPVNRKFYEKLGFTVAKTFIVNEDDEDSDADDSPIYMDAMFKYPKTIKSHSNDSKLKSRKLMLLNV